MKKILIAVLLLCLSFFLISCETTDDFASALDELTSTYVSSPIARDRINETAKKVTRAMEDIAPEEEYYIGRAVAASVLSNYSVYEDKTKEKYLNLICRSIAINSENPYCYNGYHVKLLDSDEINAYATSSGIIFITRGLYDAVTTEDELAAVIAHELAHIMLRHSTKAIRSSRWTEVTTAITEPVTSDFMRNTTKFIPSSINLADKLDGMVSDITSELIIKGYSKVQEFEADRKAVQLLADAGYSPEAMISMLEILVLYQKKSQGGFFSTHPDPQDRIDNVYDTIYDSHFPRDTRKYRRDRFVAVKQGS